MAWLLIAASLAGALQTTPSPRPSHPLRLPTLVFAGAAAADWITTYRLLGPHQSDTGHEHNPLLGWCHDRKVPTVTAGAALDILGVWAWTSYVGRKHPKWAAFGLYAAAAVRVGFAVRNHRWTTRANRVRYGAWIASS